MSKKSKTIKMQRIPMNQIDFDAFICGWAGCTNSAQANTPEAAGWKSVMITSGSFLVKENLYNAQPYSGWCKTT